MNSNSNKQVLLSVIGVFVLVVAVVGVSFAFFTYARTGANNNQITTGSISFTFTDGDFINLVNHFPITSAQGLALSGTNNICKFTVKGKASTGSIAFDVWALPGDAIADKTRFKDSEVFVNIKQDSTVTNMTFTSATGASTGKAISTLTSGSANGISGRKLGTGSITGTGTEVTGTFTVRMWVDSSVVSIGETGTYSAEAYGNLYYTMKIAVTAQA